MRIACLLLLLTGCVMSPDERETAALRPAAQLDAYLMAHGMVRSYLQSPEADPALVQQLVDLDIRAAASIRAPDAGARASAIAALADLAARRAVER